MKVVLDAHVLVAAFAARGLCEGMLEFCLDNHEILLSHAILLEVGEKLDTKLNLPEATREEILDFLRDHATIVELAAAEPSGCRDEDDLVVLGTAKAARAAYLVTGDKDLLALGSYAETAIVSPRQFWESQSRRNR